MSSSSPLPSPRNEDPIPRVARRRPGRPRTEDLARRSDELLAVAEAALVELGYECATLDLIATRARVSKQTIYAKYGNKLGLLRAVLARMTGHSFGAGVAEARGLPLAEGLTVMARRILAADATPAARAIAAISLRESEHFPEFHAAMIEAERTSRREPIRSWLESFRRSGLLRDVDCGMVADSFLWLLAERPIREVTLGTASTPDREEIEVRAEFIARLMAGGVLV